MKWSVYAIVGDPRIVGDCVPPFFLDLNYFQHQEFGCNSNFVKAMQGEKDIGESLFSTTLQGEVS